MKKTLLFLLAGSLCSLTASATVRTVDNNVPSGGQYTSLSAAQAASVPGDTLYIAGSSASYGNFQFTKSLVLIGTGHNPQKDNKKVSKLDNISFTTSVINTKVIGIRLDDYTGGSGHSNFAIERCRIDGIVYLPYSSISNGLLEGNVFAGATNIFTNQNNVWNNIKIRNNVFNGASQITISNTSLNVLFLNNLFLFNGNAFYGSSYYLTFKNNIYYRTDPVANVTNSTFENNVMDPANTYTFSGGTGNTFVTVSSVNTNIKADPLFVNFPAAGADFDYSHDYHLQAASTLKNAGTDGKDIGLTGGDGYFDINGIPPIPQVYKLDITTPADGIVSPGSNITIDLRSTIKR